LNDYYETMRILKNQPNRTFIHPAAIWSGERGASPELSVMKQALSFLLFPPDFRPVFSKNSGWIKKTYQRISPFAKSTRQTPLSGNVPEDQVRKRTCEKIA